MITNISMTRDVKVTPGKVGLSKEEMS